jgi:hypothetical protein
MTKSIFPLASAAIGPVPTNGSPRFRNEGAVIVRILAEAASDRTSAGSLIHLIDCDHEQWRTPE